MFYETDKQANCESVVSIKLMAYSKITDLSDPDDNCYIIGGIIAKINNMVPGFYIGSRIVALGKINQIEKKTNILSDSQNIIASPKAISFSQAVAASEYICKINFIREYGAQLASNYSLTENDALFSSLLDAMGYVRTESENPDILLNSNPKSFIPGCDWKLFTSNDKNVKYPEFITTTVKNNIELYFNLVKNERIIPALSMIVLLENEHKTEERMIKSQYEEFSVCSDYLANRKKPMIVVYVSSRDKTVDQIVKKIDSLIGEEHAYIDDSKINTTVSYKDGSTASIMYVPDIKSEYIECHFDGITIVKEAGVIKTF